MKWPVLPILGLSVGMAATFFLAWNSEHGWPAFAPFPVHIRLPRRGQPASLLADSAAPRSPGSERHARGALVPGHARLTRAVSGGRREVGLLGRAAAAVWINDRHQPLLESAKEHVEKAMRTLEQPLPTDLATVHLQAAIASLGEITGETATPDVLENIFRNFCIGK